MAQTDSSRADSGGFDWSRATDGVFLMGLGVFALLNASGRLPWSFWYDALSMWPLLLVSAGMRIAFGRSPWPWLALLGPLVVLALLGALATGRLESMPGAWQPVSVAREEGAKKVRLRPKIVSSRIEVASRPLPEGIVLEGRQGSRENKALAESRVDEAGLQRVGVTLQKMSWASYVIGRTSRWELGVTNRMPIVLDVDGAMLGTRFDFTQGGLESAAFRGAYLSIDMRLPRPQAPTKIEMHGAFNAAELTVPPGTPVRVQGTGFPFNLVDRGTDQDPNDPANPGYDVRFYGVFSRVSVTDGSQR